MIKILIRVQPGLGNRLQHKRTHPMVLFFSSKHKKKCIVSLQYHKLTKTRQFVQRGHETTRIFLKKRPAERSRLGQRRRLNLLLHQQHETQIRRLLLQPILHPQILTYHFNPLRWQRQCLYRTLLSLHLHQIAKIHQRIVKRSSQTNPIPEEVSLSVRIRQHVPFYLI